MISFEKYFDPVVTVSMAGQTFGSVPGLDAPRVSFRITRSIEPVPDTAEIAVYNLAPERRAAMSTVFSAAGRSGVALTAGYGTVQAPVFFGFARSMRSGLGLADGDVVLRVTADDAGDVVRDARLNLPPFALRVLTPAQMIDIAVAALNEMLSIELALFTATPSPFPPIVKHPSVDAAILALGALAAIDFREASGGEAASAFGLLDKAARMLRCRWWIRDGMLMMSRLGLVNDPGIAVVLPPETWLAEPDDDGSGIIRAPVLFDYNLAPGRAVSFVSRQLPGVPEPCRVEYVQHTGDNYGDSPWASTITARRLAA